jgi:hypothetical protein
LTAEGCRSVESQLGVENVNEVLILLDDEVQQRSNRMSQGQAEKQQVNKFS